MSNDPSPPKTGPVGRSPCLVVAAAFGAGIATDHLLPMPRPAILVAAGVLLLPLLIPMRARHPYRLAPRLRVAALLVLFLLLGAAGHGSAWRDRGEDSIVRRLRDQPALVRLTGYVVSAPRIERRRESGRSAAWPLEDRTRFTLDLKEIEVGPDGHRAPATGRIQFTSAGHVLHVAAGDRIEATAWLARPPAPRNPGEFDIRDYLRQRHIDATAYVDHPDAVRRISAPTFDWRRFVSSWRDRLAVRFADHLSETNGPIGAAMILGDRSAMPLDVRDAYVASGAMHILAISGLNVGIFAVFLMAIGRVVQASSRWTIAVVAVCIWSYAVLTDLEPPVVRAALFLTVWSLGTVMMRRLSPLNTVAATALVLLVYDPLLLFDVGAQLSFLAVTGMVWTTQAFPAVGRWFEDFHDGRFQMPHWGGAFLSAQLMGVGVWLFTAPLIAAHFEIVSPIGLLLNVALVPLATLVMWSGYAFFGVCLLLPQAAGPFGAVFDGGLSLINAIVLAAGTWRLGHLAVPPPPAWWLTGFYLWLTVDLLRPNAARRWRRWSLLAAWSGIGLASGLVPAAPADMLRVTTFDIGHGGAILVEAPNGRSILFDCGSMEDDRRVGETVWNAMRQRRRTMLDAVLLSHADLDHCNNLPALLRGGRVGSVMLSRSFLDFDQPVVTAACEAARSEGVPIRLVSAGDRLHVDREVAIEVLHPPDRRPAGDDNGSSLVLRIRYGGRTLLLTGDLEGAGQIELRERYPDENCDVLFAPHHGGRNANTAELQRWARPNAVVVSASRRVSESALQSTYADARLYLTPRHGAVMISVREDGWMGIESFLDAASDP